MDFHSKVNIDDNRKVDILLKLMESFRSQIMAWHDRAYVAAVGSLGLLLGVTKLWIDTENKELLFLIGYVSAIVIFEILTQLYLRTTRHNYEGNEEGKLKCEYALRLKDEDAYFSEAMFFWKGAADKDIGLPPRDIDLLIKGHIVTSALLVAVCIIAFF